MTSAKKKNIPLKRINDLLIITPQSIYNLNQPAQNQSNWHIRIHFHLHANHSYLKNLLDFRLSDLLSNRPRRTIIISKINWLPIAGPTDSLFSLNRYYSGSSMLKGLPLTSLATCLKVSSFLALKSSLTRLRVALSYLRRAWDYVSVTVPVERFCERGISFRRASGRQAWRTWVPTWSRHSQGRCNCRTGEKPEAVCDPSERLRWPCLSLGL